MSGTLPEPLRRLAHPRSERADLWACVYCGAIEDRSDGEDRSNRSGSAD